VEASPAPVHLVIPFTIDNRIKGEVYGVEWPGSFPAKPMVAAAVKYTPGSIQLHKKAGSNDRRTLKAREE